MDKATPDSVPATYGSVMALYKEVVHTMLHDEEGVFQAEAEFRAEVERLAAQSAPTEPIRPNPELLGLAGGRAGFDCEYAPPAVAQSAPLQQAECTCAAKDMPFGRCCRAAAQVEPPSMPSSEWLAEAERLASVCRTHIATLEDHRALNAHLSKRVTAQVEPVRMLTQPELNDVALSEKVGWGPGEYVEAVQRKFAEVNGLRIPADGKIGDAA